MLDVARIAGEDGVPVCNEKRERRVRDVAGVRVGEQMCGGALVLGFRSPSR
jgi:hypothetical protein